MPDATTTPADASGTAAAPAANTADSGNATAPAATTDASNATAPAAATADVSNTAAPSALAADAGNATAPAAGAATTPDQQLKSLPQLGQDIIAATSDMLGVICKNWDNTKIWGATGALALNDIENYFKTTLQLKDDISSAITSLKGKVKGTPVGDALHSVVSGISTALKLVESKMTAVNSTADQAANFKTVVDQLLPKATSLLTAAGVDATKFTGPVQTAGKLFDAAEAVVRFTNQVEGVIAFIVQNIDPEPDAPAPTS